MKNLNQYIVTLCLFAIALGCGTDSSKKNTSPRKDKYKLDLSSDSHLKQFPSEIYRMSDLKHLDISNTQISGWDERICQLENLETLVGRNNTYKNNEVPFDTFCLKNLKILDLSNSSIQYIDEHISNLKNLEELHMSDNNIVSAPYMLISLKNLRLVNFSNNPHIKDKDLKTLQICEDLDDKGCREDIAESFECEFYNSIPYQRKKPFRAIYIDLVDSSDEIKKVCKENGSYLCPHYVKSCQHIMNTRDRKLCMLNKFENLNIHPDLWINRDVCYESWNKWYNDFTEFPERTGYSIAGRTIDEMLLRTKYNKENGNPSMMCWNSLSPVSDTDLLWWDNKPDRIGPQRVEVFPKKKRKFAFSDGVMLAIREGPFDWFSYDDQTIRSKYVEYADHTNKCPHLKDLKRLIEKRIDK